MTTQTQSNVGYSESKLRGYWTRSNTLGREGLDMLVWCINQAGPVNKNSDPILTFLSSADNAGNDTAASLIRRIFGHVTYGYNIRKDNSDKPHKTGLKLTHKKECGFNTEHPNPKYDETDKSENAEPQTINPWELLQQATANDLGLNNAKRLKEFIGIVTIVADFDVDKYAKTSAAKLLREKASLEQYIAKLTASYKAQKEAQNS